MLVVARLAFSPLPSGRHPAAVTAALVVLAGVAGLVRAPAASAQLPSYPYFLGGQGFSLGYPYGAGIYGGFGGYNGYGYLNYAGSGSLPYSLYPATGYGLYGPSLPFPSGLPNGYGTTPGAVYANVQPAGTAPERSYSLGGQYCLDQSGGQVWVPAGGPTDGLNCSAAASGAPGSGGPAPSNSTPGGSMPSNPAPGGAPPSSTTPGSSTGGGATPGNSAPGGAPPSGMTTITPTPSGPAPGGSTSSGTMPGSPASGNP